MLVTPLWVELLKEKIKKYLANVEVILWKKNDSVYSTLYRFTDEYLNICVTKFSGYLFCARSELYPGLFRYATNIM